MEMPRVLLPERMKYSDFEYDLARLEGRVHNPKARGFTSSSGSSSSDEEHLQTQEASYDLYGGTNLGSPNGNNAGMKMAATASGTSIFPAQFEVSETTAFASVVSGFVSAPSGKQLLVDHQRGSVGSSPPHLGSSPGGSPGGSLYSPVGGVRSRRRLTRKERVLMQRQARMAQLHGEQDAGLLSWAQSRGISVSPDLPDVDNNDSTSKTGPRVVQFDDGVTVDLDAIDGDRKNPPPASSSLIASSSSTAALIKRAGGATSSSSAAGGRLLGDENGTEAGRSNGVRPPDIHNNNRTTFRNSLSPRRSPISPLLPPQLLMDHQHQNSVSPRTRKKGTEHESFRRVAQPRQIALPGAFARQRWQALARHPLDRSIAVQRNVEKFLKTFFWRERFDVEDVAVVQHLVFVTQLPQERALYLHKLHSSPAAATVSSNLHNFLDYSSKIELPSPKAGRRLTLPSSSSGPGGEDLQQHIDHEIKNAITLTKRGSSADDDAEGQGQLFSAARKRDNIDKVFMKLPLPQRLPQVELDRRRELLRVCSHFTGEGVSGECARVLEAKRSAVERPLESCLCALLQVETFVRVFGAKIVSAGRKDLLSSDEEIFEVNNSKNRGTSTSRGRFIGREA
ncbi:unnamed protein product, partial [Amoebophrya sp. A25]|eukprot:GSA25T00026348001.1